MARARGLVLQPTLPAGSACRRASRSVASADRVSTSSPLDVKRANSSVADSASQSVSPAVVSARSTRPSTLKTLPSQSRNDPGSGRVLVWCRVASTKAQHALDPAPSRASPPQLAPPTLLRAPAGSCSQRPDRGTQASRNPPSKWQLDRDERAASCGQANHAQALSPVGATPHMRSMRPIQPSCKARVSWTNVAHRQATTGRDEVHALARRGSRP